MPGRRGINAKTRDKVIISRFFSVVFGLCIIIIDQIIKQVLSARLATHSSIPVVQDIFHITLVHNKGVAFGMMQGIPSWVFIATAITAAGVFTYMFLRLKDEQIAPKFAVVLLCAGTLSNLADRVRFGYVIDYLDFRVWPVFNLADTAITVGACTIAVFFMRSRGRKGIFR